MSRYVQPYKGASVEGMASGVIPSGPNAGKPVTVTLYADMASKGFRSGYEATPTRWYEVCAPEVTDGGKPWRQCWSFTGRKYAEALRLFQRDVKELGLAVNIQPKP